jgi:hypothetical protein
VGLSSPSNGATFSAPATIAIAASAADPDGTVARVEFYSGRRCWTDTTSPYSFSWTGVAAGSYTLKAIAYDNTGASTTSATVFRHGHRRDVGAVANHGELSEVSG